MALEDFLLQELSLLSNGDIIYTNNNDNEVDDSNNNKWYSNNQGDVVTDVIEDTIGVFHGRSSTPLWITKTFTFTTNGSTTSTF